MRSFPWAYKNTPAGGGPVAVNGDASSMPAARNDVHYKVTPGARTSPMGSALYLPPIKAMADRSLPPEYWRGQAGGPN